MMGHRGKAAPPARMVLPPATGLPPTKLSPVWIAATQSSIFVIASHSTTFGKCLSTEIALACVALCWVAGSGMASGLSRAEHTGRRLISEDPVSILKIQTHVAPPPLIQ